MRHGQIAPELTFSILAVYQKSIFVRAMTRQKKKKKKKMMMSDGKQTSLVPCR